MQASTICFSALCLVMTVGCSHPDSLKSSQPSMEVSPSGLGSTDLIVGQGASPTLGQTCVIEVLGWVEQPGGQRRTILDTRKRGFPASFPLGVGRVIKGWEEGIATMKKGGKRLLRVPPSLGYSPAEAGSDIPSGAILYFEVELVDIR